MMEAGSLRAPRDPGTITWERAAEAHELIETLIGAAPTDRATPRNIMKSG
jgi:hypothetical protein